MRNTTAILLAIFAITTFVGCKSGGQYFRSMAETIPLKVQVEYVHVLDKDQSVRVSIVDTHR